jgi:hypothetical protein
VRATWAQAGSPHPHRLVPIDSSWLTPWPQLGFATSVACKDISSHHRLCASDSALSKGGIGLDARDPDDDVGFGTLNPSDVWGGAGSGVATLDGGGPASNGGGGTSAHASLVEGLDKRASSTVIQLTSMEIGPVVTRVGSTF